MSWYESLNTLRYLLKTFVKNRDRLHMFVDSVDRFARGSVLLGRMYVRLYCTVHVENYISYKILLKSRTPLATVSTMATDNPIPHDKSLRKWGYVCTNT